MNYWIFQGNPDIFNVTEYLRENNDIVWSVRQSNLAEHMKPGDEVFLWRAGGKKKEIAGVVAVAHLTSEPRIMPDDLASQSHWRKEQPQEIGLRVEMKIEKRCLGNKEVIKRDWINVDPELKELEILRMSQKTNYRITAAEAKRLAMLCRSVGSDWSREEDVAAIWAFKETKGGPVSKKAGSPIAHVAALIGRPVGGVYNKIMNFRHIDPQDSRAGLTNINQMDQEVWAEFYDPTSESLNVTALDDEFNLIWQQNVPGPRHVRNYNDFGEAPDDNPDELASFATRVRRGQPKFRAKLMQLYDKKCAVTGWGPPEVLEAAHIYSHAESGVNHSCNGILLRSDLHYLMDAGLLAIDPDTLEINLDKTLESTPYWDLSGQKLRPRTDGSFPSRKYLKLRFAVSDDI